MQTIQPFFGAIDAFLEAFLPPIDQVRPAACPACGNLAHKPDAPLGIVGHGTYERHVRGIDAAMRYAMIRIRRFLCRACEQTISVLPDLLHPRRWYGAWAILTALVLHLMRGTTATEIAERAEIVVESVTWRTPARWRRQLLDRLWGWWGRQLGARGPAESREEGRRRLVRLLAQADASPSSLRSLPRAARALVRGTVHARGLAWRLGRTAPGSIRREARM
jgi:hypothetical protein